MAFRREVYGSNKYRSEPAHVTFEFDNTSRYSGRLDKEVYVGIARSILMVQIRAANPVGKWTLTIVQISNDHSLHLGVVV